MARHRVFETVEEMQAAIDQFKKERKKAKLPLTVQGLALALGFNSRTSLLNYEGYTDANNVEFLNTLKKARLEIEDSKVLGAMTGDLVPSVVIFDLKNNHGHKDKQEVEHQGVIEQKKVDYSNLTDKELDELYKLTAKLNGTESGEGET